MDCSIIHAAFSSLFLSTDDGSSLRIKISGNGRDGGDGSSPSKCYPPPFTTRWGYGGRILDLVNPRRPHGGGGLRVFSTQLEHHHFEQA